MAASFGSLPRQVNLRLASRLLRRYCHVGRRHRIVVAYPHRDFRIHTLSFFVLGVCHEFVRPWCERQFPTHLAAGFCRSPEQFGAAFTHYIRHRGGEGLISEGLVRSRETDGSRGGSLVEGACQVGYLCRRSVFGSRRQYIESKYLLVVTEVHHLGRLSRGGVDGVER